MKSLRQIIEDGMEDCVGLGNACQSCITKIELIIRRHYTLTPKKGRKILEQQRRTRRLNGEQ